MSSTVARKSTRRKAGVGLDGVVLESASRVQGKSAAEGGSAIGKAAGAVAKKSDVLADPPKGRKKTPAELRVVLRATPRKGGQP